MVNKMRMFGFMQKAASKSAPAPAAAPAPVASSSGSSTAPGNKFDMKNLGSIMRIKSTGCKSCGA